MCNHERKNLTETEAEVQNLRRKVKLLERDNRMLVVINQNAERLRRSYEAEKNLQYLYNDLLLENCPNMIFLFNEQLRFVICSQACESLLAARNRQDLINLPFEEVFSDVVDPEWIKKVHLQNQAVLKTLQSCSYDDTLIFPEDRMIHVQVTVSPIVDEDEACRGTVLSVNDVTELVLARQREEEASASKSSFLANMSHEIRTPMNAIKGLSELLALTELNALQRNYITNVISASNSLLGIINDVLDFSKIDAKKIEFIEMDYNLAEMIKGVCNVVNVRAAEKNLMLYIEADPTLPSGLRGDDVRIKQIITNLLSNAVKYTRAGFVRIRMRMEAADGRHWLVCEVADSGIGIAEDELAGIFDAFSRADLHTNRHITGTGLGLAISKQLALAMGGDIWVDSVQGKGSTFGFKIPQVITDAAPLAAVSQGEMKQVLLIGEGVHIEELKRQLSDLKVPYQSYCRPADMVAEMRNTTHCIAADSYDREIMKQLKEDLDHARFAEVRDMKNVMALSEDFGTILYQPLLVTDLAGFLNDKAETKQPVVSRNGIDGLAVRDTLALVVDDNEINRIVCSKMLAGFAAEVECADSGEQALLLCDEKKYDIIFMDHMMPGMDGVEATQAIRTGGGINTNTPIVALTANVVNDMKAHYLENGMDDFIGKPMELADLSRVLLRWLPNDKLAGSDERAAEPEAGPDRKIYSEVMTSSELIAALDNFGMYSSDVLREMGGDFDGYIQRMEEAFGTLGPLTASLKAQVADSEWDGFAGNMLKLNAMLYGIGARDCAARARKLSQAGKEQNVSYIHEDFYSLMGNMYMLEKKMEVIVPAARDNEKTTFINSPEFIYGCLKQMAKAIADHDRAEAFLQLDQAAALSLDKELDRMLQLVRGYLEAGDFQSAGVHNGEMVREYAVKTAVKDTSQGGV